MGTCLILCSYKCILQTAARKCSNSQTPSLLAACRALGNKNEIFQQCFSFTACTGDICFLTHGILAVLSSTIPLTPLTLPICLSIPQPPACMSVVQTSPLRAAPTASADGQGWNPLQEPYLTHHVATPRQPVLWQLNTFNSWMPRLPLSARCRAFPMREFQGHPFSCVANTMCPSPSKDHSG